MILASAIIWICAFVLAAVVYRRSGKTGLRATGDDAFKTLKLLIIRLPCAVLAVTFLLELIPVDLFSTVIGRETGLIGIILAGVGGGFLPGGPMVTFPIAVVLMEAGAGLPQLIALISGWSVFALNRLLTYEAPIMGWRFAILRHLSCLAVPVLAGLGAELVLVLLRLP